MARSSRQLSAALAEWLVRGRVYWFVLGILLTLVAYPLSQRLTYNRSLEGFFPKTDSRLQLYQKNKSWFGGEGTLIVAYSDNQLWTPAGMERQLTLTEAIKKLRDQGVVSAVCLADRALPKQPFMTIAEAIKTDAVKPDEIKEQVRRADLYHRVFVADDGVTTAVWVQLLPTFDNAAQQAECLEAVRRTARDQLQPAVSRGETTVPVAAGTPLMIHDVYEYVESDGRRLEIVSLLLMGLVIAVSFRRVLWLILPLLIVYATLYWSEALWTVMAGEMTMVGSAISSLVAIIGVSTVVHFGLEFQDAVQVHEPAAALKQTFQEVGPPVFWVLLTTAGGFAALLVCELKPVLDFAWLMLIASVLVGAAIMAFIPLVVIGFRQVQAQEPRHGFMARTMASSFHWIMARPWQTSLGIIVPFAFLSIGMLWMKPQTDFTRNFRQSTEIFRAYDFIETRLGGAGQLDLVFDSPDLEKMPAQELAAFFRKLRELRMELSPLPGVTKALSLVDFVDFFDASALGKNLPLSARVKLLDGRVDEALKEVGFAARLIPAAQVEKFKAQPRIAPLFWNREDGKMRVTLQVQERLPSEVKDELLESVQQVGGKVLGDDRRPQITGIYVMLAHLIESVLEDQNKTFAVSLLCQFGMAVAAFRSFRLALMAMLPTVLPVIAVVGTMGWLGLRVNIATAMLASVAMGMTIDSSILYICRFQRELRDGKDFQAGLVRTHASAGIGVVISNVAIVLGFGALILSRFIPLVEFGIFSAMALFGGMVGNLVLLPLLLQLTPGKPRPKTTLSPSNPSG